jgi:hypothetical protein
MSNAEILSDGGGESQSATERQYESARVQQQKGDEWASEADEEESQDA